MRLVLLLQLLVFVSGCQSLQAELWNTPRVVEVSGAGDLRVELSPTAANPTPDPDGVLRVDATKVHQLSLPRAVPFRVLNGAHLILASGPQGLLSLTVRGGFVDAHVDVDDLVLDARDGNVTLTGQARLLELTLGNAACDATAFSTRVARVSVDGASVGHVRVSELVAGVVRSGELVVHGAARFDLSSPGGVVTRAPDVEAASLHVPLRVSAREPTSFRATGVAWLASRYPQASGGW